MADGRGVTDGGGGGGDGDASRAQSRWQKPQPASLDTSKLERHLDTLLDSVAHSGDPITTDAGYADPTGADKGVGSAAAEGGAGVEADATAFVASVLTLLKLKRKDKFVVMRAACLRTLESREDPPDLALLGIVELLIKRGVKRDGNVHRPALSMLLEAYAALRGRQCSSKRAPPGAAAKSSTVAGPAAGSDKGSKRLSGGEHSIEASKRCALLLNGAMAGSLANIQVEIMTLMWRAFDAFSYLDAGLAKAYAQHQLDTGSAGAAAELIENLSLTGFDPGNLVRAMVRANDWLQAERYVEALLESERSNAVEALIRAALERQKFKYADRYSRAFRPAGSSHGTSTSSHFQLDVIRRLAQDGQIAVATAFVGANDDARLFLLEELMRLGDYSNVQEIRTKFEVADERFSEEAIEIAIKAGESTAAGCARLPDAVSVTVVTSAAGLEAMSAALQAEQASTPVSKIFAIGIDAEWRPTIVVRGKVVSGGGSTGAASRKKRPVWPASVLQISTRSQAFLLDLLALHACKADLPGRVGWLFSDRAVLKVGFGLDGDLSKLCASYDAWESMFGAPVFPVVEVIDVVRTFLPERSIRVSNLASAVYEVLGRPLSKEQQLSDWQVRPLSSAQREYAALDAYVLVAMLDKLLLHGEGVEGGIESLQVRTRPLTRSLTAIKGAAPNMPGAYTPAALVEPASKPVGGKPSEDPTMAPLGVDDVLAAIATVGLSPDRITEVGHSATVSDAASAVGVSVGRIVKTLGFCCNGQFAAVLVAGDGKVSNRVLAARFGTSRRKVRMASLKECVEVFGYLPGSFPPIALRSAVTTLIDRRLAGLSDDIYCGGGSATHLLRLSGAELLEYSGGEILDLVPSAECAEPPDVAPTSGSGAGAGEMPSFRYSEVAKNPDEDDPRFLVDSMLGRLARWLRVIGVNAAYQRTNNPDLLVTTAAEDNRIIVTRDRKLVMRRDCGAAYLVSSNDVGEQFSAVLEHFGISPDSDSLMSRCSKCNSDGYERVSHEEAADTGEVPSKVLALDPPLEFWRCKDCKWMYWEGPKFFDARDRFQAVLAGQEGAIHNIRFPKGPGAPEPEDASE